MACKILYLEPFYGGSHKDFADGLIAHSRHSYTLKTLPDRFWKWRMRGAALHFAHTVSDPEQYDLIFTSGMMSISDLKSLLGPQAPPVVLYLHEDQLSYPVPQKDERDIHFAFTDLTSALSSDTVLFNSRFHRDAFFSHIPGVLKLLPEFRPLWISNTIRSKTEIVYPGVNIGNQEGRDDTPRKPAVNPEESPLILWNHRWEFDKSPDIFFDALYALEKTGADFRLALAGENFQVVPTPFIEARDHFGDRVVHYGFVEKRSDYLALLNSSDIVVSTAIQENFGISVIEAVLSGCYPLLPTRLVYPEIIPEEYHSRCLYSSAGDLVEKLAALVSEKPVRQPAGLKKELRKFQWLHSAEAFDALFDRYDPALNGEDHEKA